MKILRFFCCLFLCAGAVVQAAPEPPVALTHAVAPLSQVDRLAVPPPRDLKALRDEDAERQRQGLPPRYALGHSVAITPENAGTWETLDAATRVWRLVIAAPGAESINLGFGTYQMPEGGRLTLYSSDYEQRVRSFTADDNEAHGQLWTPIIRSDELVIEVVVPAAAASKLELKLNHIGYGYRGFGPSRFKGKGQDKSGACNVDVVCSEGDDWRNEIASVAVISTGGETFCTGFMVNNTAFDLTPYFMTADHCGIDARNAPSLVAYWNFQASTCGGPRDGVLADFNTGSDFLASYAPTDFTLLRLDDDPSPESGVSFAGWDRSMGDFAGATAIHHPSADEKAISFEFDSTTTTFYDVDTPSGQGDHIRVADWDIGTTEPGSSGSPLFSPEGRVIGQLHGGAAACGNNEPDWYGRFSLSWEGGGSADTRLRDWLDPIGSGAVTTNTISGIGMAVLPGEDTLHYGPVGGPFTNDPLVYQLQNPTGAPIDFEVRSTRGLGLLLDGGSGPIGGTLGAGGSRQVEVSLGPAIAALPAGIQVETLEFRDLTNDVLKTRTHSVEVGLSGFAVDPEEDLADEGPVGGPFPASQTYRLTSTRPTPAVVAVSAAAPWVSLNGQPGPLTFALNQEGQEATVVVAFSDAADSLVPGVYETEVRFVDQAGATDVRRGVALDVGRITYAATDTPRAIRDFETSVSAIQVPEDFCIGDVDVVIDVSHTWIGDLTVDLAAPSGLPVRLHDRSGGGASDIVQRYDDAARRPDGPGTLGAFGREAVTGTWRLRVTDHAGLDQGSIQGWSLEISPAGDGCPTRETLYSFPLDSDPGWAREGLWAYGQPSGGGGEDFYGFPDPASGWTGAAVFGYNLAGDYENNLPPRSLTTHALDLTGFADTHLTFWRRLNVENSIFDAAAVEVSNDGENWRPVFQHLGDATDAAWNQYGYDIGTVADNEPTVYVRWIMGGTDSSVRLSGWNIDDIEVRAVADPVLAYYPDIQEVYIAYYGRSADPAGRRFWAEQLQQSGGNLDAIIDAFGTSQEFLDEYGDLTNEQLIETVYRQMFCRAPEPAGRDFYLERLQSGAMTLPTITLDILNGAQNEDAQAVANKLVVADYFTEQVENLGLNYQADDIAAARSVLETVCADPGAIDAGFARADEVLSGL